MKTNDYGHLSATIERRDALVAEREQLHAELQVASDLPSLRLQTSDLRLARKDQRDQLEHREVANPDNHPTVRELDEQISANELRIAEAESKTERLQGRIREIDAELNGLRAGSLKAVLDHQGALDAAEGEVVKLETLLAEHQARVAAATDYEDPLPALEKQREDLLANIATGDAKEADLKQLDAQIEEASAGIADKISRAKATVDRSGATLRGLEKRLDAARAERDRLAAMTPRVLTFALRAEAEAAGKEYRRHADRLVAAFKRLMGLGTIMDGIDRREAGRLGYRQGNSLRLPKFNLDAFDDLANDTGHLYLFNAESDRSYRTESEQDERKRLAEQGIRLS